MKEKTVHITGPSGRACAKQMFSSIQCKIGNLLVHPAWTNHKFVNNLKDVMCLNCTKDLTNEKW